MVQCVLIVKATIASIEQGSIEPPSEPYNISDKKLITVNQRS